MKYIDLSLKNYLSQLSSESPVPGGGGTSALVAALGVSLALMVARISLKKLDPKKQKTLNKTIKLFEHMRRDAEQVIDLDPKVYQEVMASYAKLKQFGKTFRNESRVETALSNSFRLQADLALLILMAKQSLSTIDSFSKGSIRNDLIVSSGLLDGAFRGAVATARINIVYMKPSREKRHFERGLAKLEQKYKRIRFE
jgi:formiminotetrahydrofolate cyclodeaminase